MEPENASSEESREPTTINGAPAECFTNVADGGDDAVVGVEPSSKSDPEITDSSKNEPDVEGANEVDEKGNQSISSESQVPPESAPDMTFKQSSTTALSKHSLKGQPQSLTRSSDSDAPIAAHRSSGLELFTLPVDAVHAVASFLAPSEWSTFGQTSKSSSILCKEVLRRVRLHGFRCATEVVSAWKLGEHEDSKELAALYLESGVPIHPQCLGHSYHTILWRMKIESLKMKLPVGYDDDENEEREEVSLDAPQLDPFFFGRKQSRQREEHNEQMTYVEEKGSFFVEERVAELERTGMSRFASRREAHDSSRESKALIPMRVHQHLLDQHTSNKSYVNDQDGAIVSPCMSMSADFFHPSKLNMSSPQSKPVLVGGLALSSDTSSSTYTYSANIPTITGTDVMDGNTFAHGQRMFAAVAPVPLDRPNSVLSKMDLTAYDSTSTHSRNKDPSSANSELFSHLRTRFATYGRRLEGLWAKSDHDGFDECLFDFWDEFFPHSSGIHYHDLHTAVPRLSGLQKFLTKPLPKSMGVIQCEIERIKTSSRGKGMKGRLFPSYEYRLFIRNRPKTVDELDEPPDDFVRRDTLLMVAKSRGKKHLEASGVIPLSPALKKGSNNYYLHMPQQADVDAHFHRVNPLEDESAEKPKLVPNGVSSKPVIASESSSSELLGRLQSNFIGTEFQIYTPHLQKRQRSPPKINSPPFFSPSDDEFDYDSGVSSDAGSAKKSKRFRRRRQRSSGPVEESENDTPSISRPIYRRSRSCSDLPQTRPLRGKKVAIASSSDHGEQQADLYEEENGAITYTANLLGSRPRIMDVCIPKVAPDGTAAAEWKEYLETCGESQDDSRMLRSFRQLQQNIGNHDEQDAAENDGEREDDDIDDFGLLPLQNRPPWWNVELGSFVLNFGGRVSVASVKNFQLCHRNDQDNILLQFGRIQGRHSFTMDFQHPLTAVQAFCIAISSLQSKISFG